MLHNLFVRRLQYSPQARRFFMTVVALGFVVEGVYAVLLNLYLLRLGYNAQLIGQVNSVGLLAFALISLPAGVMGTRWKSSHMIRLGVGCTLLGTVLLPLAEFSPTGWQELWFIITYAMILMGFSIYFVNGSPFLMNAVDSERQSSAFAMLTALLALAAFGGSLLGGALPTLLARFNEWTLDDPQPYRYTLMLASLIVIVSFVITLTIIEQIGDDKEDEPHVDEAKPTTKPGLNGLLSALFGVIGVMSLVRFLQVAGLATSSVYFNVYLDTIFDMSPGAIGVIASIGRLIAVPTVLLAPRLIRRTSTGSVALWASLATAFCLLPIALSPFWWGAAIGYIGTMALTNLRYAAFIVFILVLVPKRQQALMAGAGETAAGFSFAFMALTGGYIATLFSFRELFLLGSFLSGLGTFVFWLHLRGVPLRKRVQLETVP